MIKTITLLERRPDLTSEEFHRHWREVHAPLVLRLPGVRKYVQGRPTTTDGTAADYDGLAEVWYDDVDAMHAALESPAYRELLADEQNFMGRPTGELIFLVVEEHQVR